MEKMRLLLLASLGFCLVSVVFSRSTRSSSHAWKYVGCYKDKRPRDLTSYHKDTSSVTGMTYERCFKFCSGYKTKFMALQHGNECRCDNNYGRYGKASDCNLRCTGDKSQTCGARYSNSVYQIRDHAATVITSSMMPLRTSSSRLVFTALGDWGKEGDAQRDVARRLGDWSDRHHSAFTAAIGDNYYEYGISGVDDSQIRTTWRNVYTHKSLQKPWLVIEGNHDYLMGNAPNQVKYGDVDKRWVMPSLYYSMHYDMGGQDVHFIFLDTDPIKNKNEYHQYKWFSEEISKSKADWVIVIGHHPVVSSGSHGSESSTATMWDNIRGDMVKYKAALYICGHDHFLEHLVDKSGIIDYVISGSGAKLRTTKSSSAVKNLQKKQATSKFWRAINGFVGVEIDGNRVKVSYIDRNGKEIHTFSKTNPRKSSGSVVG